MAMKPVEDLLDFDTVMAKLKIRRKALMRLITTGQLAAHKVGRSWRFAPSEVNSFLESVRFRAVRQQFLTKKQPRCRALRSMQSSPSANRYM